MEKPGVLVNGGHHPNVRGLRGCFRGNHAVVRNRGVRARDLNRRTSRQSARALDSRVDFRAC